jgi:hypothetical protein
MAPALALLLLPTAFAAGPAYYHPDNVAAGSKVFASAAKAMGPAFDDAQDQLAKMSRGLIEVEIGTALVGDALPGGFADWSVGTRRTVTGQFMQVQRHVDLLQDDYGRVFGAALERAIATEGEGRELKECTAGTGIQALMRRPGGGCQGDDLNGAIVRRIDADPELQAAVDEINSVPFPTVGVEARAWAPAPLTGTTRWVRAGALGKRFAKTALEREEAALAAGLAPLEARLSAGDADAVKAAGALRATYEAALAKDGEALLNGAREALKRADMNDVGVCPNAPALGGCDGEDASRAVLEALALDRKFLKLSEGI